MEGIIKLALGIFIASFVITGYWMVFLVQSIWFLINRRPDKIGDAFGQCAKGSIDAVAAVFKN